MMDAKKTQLRKSVQADLACMDSTAFIELSSKLSLNLKKFLIEKKLLDDLIGVFSPIQKEPNWSLAFDIQFSVAYPHYDQDMSFMLTDKFYKEGKPNWESTQICYPKIILVPGLAFNASGQRLGRGRGFYDRYFEKANTKCKIGLCFEKQIKKIPVNKHDQSVDLVITEENIYRG